MRTIKPFRVAQGPSPTEAFGLSLGQSLGQTANTFANRYLEHQNSEVQRQFMAAQARAEQRYNREKLGLELGSREKIAADGREARLGAARIGADATTGAATIRTNADKDIAEKRMDFDRDAAGQKRIFDAGLQLRGEGYDAQLAEVERLFANPETRQQALALMDQEATKRRVWKEQEDKKKRDAAAYRARINATDRVAGDDRKRKLNLVDTTIQQVVNSGMLDFNMPGTKEAWGGAAGQIQDLGMRLADGQQIDPQTLAMVEAQFASTLAKAGWATEDAQRQAQELMDDAIGRFSRLPR